MYKILSEYVSSNLSETTLPVTACNSASRSGGFRELARACAVGWRAAAAAAVATRAPLTVVAAPLAARADAARTAAAPACRPHNAAAPASATSQCDAASRDCRLSTHRRASRSFRGPRSRALIAATSPTRYRGDPYRCAYSDAIKTNSGSEELWQTLVRERAPLAALLLLFSAATVFGNGLVIVAVARERYLHTATNYFVTSLAVADCLVGLVVMPFSAAYEVANHAWFFGIDWCDAWRSLDVLASTASILNLCVISLDRYWAITDPFSYPARMTGRRAAALITAVWVCSGAISFPAIAWWRAVRPEHVPPYKCPFTENLSYLIFSSTISFYLPLFVMVFTYYRIYRAAVVQTRSLKLGTKQASGSCYCS
ncbi:dopamine receptor 2-like [Schistocerca gregaria]|uniref:dopamine receptor 2-like n=1 Tax=Schistocerca gregaria TaxID=7010 RepID=UPI00211E592E|nr:dopamine receptor 2-like [Schistocerca gregaria]